MVDFPAPAGPSITTTRLPCVASVKPPRMMPNFHRRTTRSQRLPDLAESGSVAAMNRSRLRRRAACMLAAAPALFALSGCVSVTPAQRANLSKPEMSPESDADEESFHTHVEAAREGSMGGHGAAGGGCGCG